MTSLEKEQAIEIRTLQGKLERATHSLREEQKQLGILQNRIDRVLFFLEQQNNPYNFEVQGLIKILQGKDD